MYVPRYPNENAIKVGIYLQLININALNEQRLQLFNVKLGRRYSARRHLQVKRSKIKVRLNALPAWVCMSTGLPRFSSYYDFQQLAVQSERKTVVIKVVLLHILTARITRKVEPVVRQPCI